MKNWMKVSLVCFMMAFGAACSKVPAGNVGVKVHLLGGEKGVDSEKLGVGRYWIGINEELYLYPTFTQTKVWGETPETQFQFQTREGMKSRASIGVSFRVDPAKVDTLFQTYRKGIDEIVDIYVKTKIRSALVEHASVRPVEAVYGSGKTELLNDVESQLSSELEPQGIIIESIYWASDVVLPLKVRESLDNKMMAREKAIQRQNEIAQTKAEAEKLREQAKGEADAKLLRAESEAKAIELTGEALRENPDVLQQMAIEKWDGVLPRITGGGTVPFVNVDKLAADKPSS